MDTVASGAEVDPKRAVPINFGLGMMGPPDNNWRQKCIDWDTNSTRIAQLVLAACPPPLDRRAVPYTTAAGARRTAWVGLASAFFNSCRSERKKYLLALPVRTRS